MLLGTTYSHREIEYLKLDNTKAFQELLSLHFDIIRLGVYWDESEPRRGVYDFSRIEVLLTACEKAGQKVIVTVGMKAPRWPEFYIPPWRQGNPVSAQLPFVLSFITKAVEKLKSYSCIQYWQVENEALDESGPDDILIPEEFLRKEIDAVKSIDRKRKILTTVWGNDIKNRGTFDIAEKRSDIVGIDLYFKVPSILNLYLGPRSRLSYYKDRIAASTKPVWITELQAEPWEKTAERKRMKDPPSLNPLLLMENFEKAKALNPEAILFWGFEYWYKRKLRGDDRYFKCINEILTTSSRR